MSEYLRKIMIDALRSSGVTDGSGSTVEAPAAHVVDAILSRITVTERGLDGLPFVFPVGTAVQKTDGYKFPGEVRATFLTRHGARRYVVEAIHPDFAGMLHIFNEQQLAEASS